MAAGYIKDTHASYLYRSNKYSCSPQIIELTKNVVMFARYTKHTTLLILILVFAWRHLWSEAYL